MSPPFNLGLPPSDPTSELLTIIGIRTLFFVLETMLLERQFFLTLAKLIGRRVARLSTHCRAGAEGHRMTCALIPGRNTRYLRRVNKGLVDVFDEKGLNIKDGSGVGSAIIIRKDAWLYANILTLPHHLHLEHTGRWIGFGVMSGEGEDTEEIICIFLTSNTLVALHFCNVVENIYIFTVDEPSSCFIVKVFKLQDLTL
ncbi:hypothetical protein B0H14DRAFT_2608051 [Mycena olivaceomarginata]|nr:hypothetical protein B0H14DRAFT_2608051 [Mycena olivaceomarginata]